MLGGARDSRQGGGRGRLPLPSERGILRESARETGAQRWRRIAMDPAHRDDPLEAGLRAAFARSSVLETLERKLGDAPRVSLRPIADERTPIVDPRTSETRALPRGRGNYQLLGEIARGGMGVILRGH